MSMKSLARWWYEQWYEQWMSDTLCDAVLHGTEPTCTLPRGHDTSPHIRTDGATKTYWVNWEALGPKPSDDQLAQDIIDLTIDTPYTPTPYKD